MRGGIAVLLRTDLGLVLALAALALGCSSEEGSESQGAGGSAGSTSKAGSGGSAGSTGGGGSGGSAGSTGGSAGSSGGSAGSTGGGGTAGATGGSSGSAGSAGTAGGPASTLSFFVSSDTSATGDLGGLTGADARCQTLGAAAGAGDRMWRAYLSAEAGPEHARDRIGDGPWYNANDELLANDLTELHALVGDPMLFIDENGITINGQWDGGDPNEHDILTGSNPDGTVATGATCADWTSAEEADAKQVGHSDGMGPGMATTGTYSSWNSAHESGGCDDTAPAGGAGRIYCFAAD